MTIKYAIVGAGAMGREHIRNIEIIDEAEVVALSDTNSESLNQSLALLTKDIPAWHLAKGCPAIFVELPESLKKPNRLGK